MADGAEIIHSQACVIMHQPAVIVEQGFGVIAICGDPIVAARLADLWTRYGLVDVPENAEGAHG